MKRHLLFLALFSAVSITAQGATPQREGNITQNACVCGDACACLPHSHNPRALHDSEVKKHDNVVPTVTVVDAWGLKITSRINPNREEPHFVLGQGDKRKPHFSFNFAKFIDTPWQMSEKVLWVPYISLGYNGLVQNLGKLNLSEGDQWLELAPKSMNFRLMLLQGNFALGNWGAVRAGLELEATNFRFKNNLTIMQNEQGLPAPDVSYADRGVTMEKSKLVSSWFNVPLTIHFTPGRRFDIYGGVVGGLRLGSYQKLRTAEFGKKHIKGLDLNLRNFHYGYTVGAYYGRLGLYASYYPQSIFRSNAANPKAQQVTVGLSMKIGY